VTPRRLSGLRSAAARWLHELPIVRPGTVIAVAVALALAGAYVYFNELDIVSTRGALADPSREFNRRWRAYQDAFGEERDFLVLIMSAPGGTGDGAPPEPSEAQRAAMKGVARRWAAELERRPDLFQDVIVRVPPSELGDYALLYLPLDAVKAMTTAADELFPTLEAVASDPRAATLLEEVRRMVDDLEPAVGASTRDAETDSGVDPDDASVGADVSDAPDASRPSGSAAAPRAGSPALPRTGSPALTQTGSAAARIAVLETLLGWVRREIAGNDAAEAGVGPGARSGTATSFGVGADAMTALGLGGVDPEGYLFIGDGRVLTALADARERPDARNRYEEVMTVGRTAVDVALSAVPDSIRLEAGLTGEPALEHEETVTSQSDFARSTAWALLLVSLLFMWAFRTVLRPGLAALCLGMSLAMTFGVAWLTIGHLNVLAMVFAVILVALGIDFAIHLFTHYQIGRESGHEPEAAVHHTYDTVGATLWLAGIATASAFLTAYFTDFPGLSELGIIAGLGLVVCLTCMYLVFPAMLVVLDRSHRVGAVRPRRALPGIGTLSRPGSGPAPRVFIVLSVVVAALGFVFGQYDRNTDLLALQPVQGEAARWQQVLLDTEDRTTYALATYPDRSAMERARRAFEASPVVSTTESAFPAAEEEKRLLLDAPCRRLRSIEPAPVGAVSVRDTRRALFGLRQTLRRYTSADRRAQEALRVALGETEATLRALGALDPATAEARLRSLASTLHDATRTGVTEARRLACPPPLERANVPSPMRARFIGDDGTLALRIYPARDTWDSQDLEWFIGGARAVDPAIFGGIVNVHENARAMVRSFVEAALYASMAILVLLLVWSRSLRRTALSVLPLALGFGLLLGVMRWGPLPVRWNLANLFAVPILIGIGIDGGVHLVCGWTLGGRETFRGAMEAVLMSALTTMIGFGLLATGQHQGVASLGLIVFLGIGLNLIVCLAVLPPALAWLYPKPTGEMDP